MNVVAVPFTGLTGVTVITGVMFSDQLSSVPVPGLGVGELERPDAGDPLAGQRFWMSTVWPSRVESVPVG